MTEYKEENLLVPVGWCTANLKGYSIQPSKIGTCLVGSIEFQVAGISVFDVVPLCGRDFSSLFIDLSYIPTAMLNERLDIIGAEPGNLYQRLDSVVGRVVKIKISHTSWDYRLWPRVMEWKAYSG